MLKASENISSVRIYLVENGLGYEANAFRDNPDKLCFSMLGTGLIIMKTNIRKPYRVSSNSINLIPQTKPSNVSTREHFG